MLIAKTEPEKPKAADARVAQALFQGRESENQPERQNIEFDAKFTVSDKEVLRQKDFAQMSALEIAEATKSIANLILPVDRVKTRRYRSAPNGRVIDPRAMFRDSLRTGGDLLLPSFRKKREIHPPLVVLADISGSMSQYTRIFPAFPACDYRKTPPCAYVFVWHSVDQYYPFVTHERPG